MANIITRRKVLELRQKGLSYSQIKKEMKINQSTLSMWLRDYPLNPEQLENLNKNDAKSERFRITMKAKKDALLHKYCKNAKGLLLPLTNKELFIAGLFLYWGEGSKTRNGLLSISNTNPAFMQFSLLWMREALHIPKNKITVLLHIYSDMDKTEMVSYWSNVLRIPESQFSKPYIKESKKISLDYKGYGHGTCMLRVCNTYIAENVLMSIKAFDEYSKLRINEL